jgi:hypothetical protein
MAGLSLSFNIFDGGAKRVRLAGAHYRRTQAQARAEQMAANVKLQVREAYLNLTTAQQRLEVSRDAQSQAEESLREIEFALCGSSLLQQDCLAHAAPMKSDRQRRAHWLPECRPRSRTSRPRVWYLTR